MDTLKTIVIALVVSGVAVVGVLTTIAPTVQPEVIVSGVNPDIHTYMNVAGPFAYGKPCQATSTRGSVTLQSSEVENGQCITVQTEGAADSTVTLTLAASSTQFCPTQEGAVKRWFIQNATTSATVEILFAGGTGVALKQATTSGLLIPGDTDGENFAVIDVKRNADTDCTAFIDIYKD